MDHKCEQIESLMEITKTFKDPLTRQAKKSEGNTPLINSQFNSSQLN